MNKLKKAILYVLLLVLLSISAAAQCNTFNTPVLHMSPILELNQDVPFFYDINATAGNETVQYSWVPINITFKSFSVGKNTGIINLTPRVSDIGVHDVFIIATTPLGCYDIRRLTLRIYDRPIIETTMPPNPVSINETQPILFWINASTLQKEKLTYEWYFDGKKLKEDTYKYLLRTNYSSSGKHMLTVAAIDSRGLNATFDWTINVINKNRRPYVKYDLPDLVISNLTDGKVMNLYNYIFDPDGDMLTFKARFSESWDRYNYSNSSIIFDSKIGIDGYLYLYPKAKLFFREYVVINATDTQGASFETPPFYIRLATAEDKIDYFNSISTLDKCEARVVCGDWSECLPTGIKIRECYDSNNCNSNNSTALESEECEYNATCTDNIMNQGEEGVDCGGPCDACPTCTDNIMNQGEEGVDCGGPCKDCPNCFDFLKNQDETDIDCGGICDACDAGKTCIVHSDCQSMVCTNNICKEATCTDFRKNQGEEGIDCGGPCQPCPSCVDNIKNQDEVGIDCGGPCKPCMSCSDGVKNQGEKGIDCGGPCDACNFMVIFEKFKIYFIAVFSVIVLMVFALIFKKVYSRNRKGYMGLMATLFNFLPKKLPEDYSAIFINTVNSLNTVRQEVFNLTDKRKVSDDYKNAIDSFFKKIFEMEETPTRRNIKASSASRIKNPFLRDLFVQIYDYTSDLSPDAPLFKIELNSRIDQVITLLNDIREYL